MIYETDASSERTLQHTYGPTVSHLMTRNVTTVNEKDSLDTAYRILQENNFRHLPIVNDEFDLVGIISDKDILRAFVNDNDMLHASADQALYLADRSVREIMSVEPETISEDDSIVYASDTLLENKFDCLPVTEGKHLVGILTTSDILRAIAQSGSVEL